MIASKVENIAAYEKIYLGFPVWWYVVLVKTVKELKESCNATLQEEKFINMLDINAEIRRIFEE